MTTQSEPWWYGKPPPPAPVRQRPVRRAPARASRHQIQVTVSVADFHRALGPRGMPVTLAFTHNALTLSTPQRHTRIPVQTVANEPGTHTAGIRPRDADAFRSATAGRDASATLCADALRLTLVLPDCSVTIGRW